MSKIIRQPTAWWFECSHICPRCGCVYSVDFTDNVQALEEDDSHYVYAVVSLCPVCDLDVQTDRKTARTIREDDDLVAWNIVLNGPSYPVVNAGLGGR